ncbi:hypothetical protein OF83DRAFT_1083622 [Amylostereum chailletii]|nr:hypothetical protein OF83DRAFT_1083622 [Amylostereum chailletii]
MARFAQLLSSVVVALAFASSTALALSPTAFKHATHRVRAVGRDAALKLETFHPASSFETFGTDGLDHPLSKRDGFDLTSAAMAFVASKLGIDSDAIAFTSGFVGDVSKHAFIKQKSNGITFANAVANVVFNNDDKVASFGSSFVKFVSIADSTPSVSQEDAIATAEKTLDGTFNEHPPTLEYLVKEDNTAALVHVIQIQNAATNTWYEAFVDAHDNKVISVTDFVVKATYRVLPIREEILTQGFQNLVDPENADASPNGWINGTTTSGNNVVAAKGSTSAPESSSGSFIFTQDPSAAPTTSTNIDAAITNAFYVANTVHDISYLLHRQTFLGLTEDCPNMDVPGLLRYFVRLHPALTQPSNPALRHALPVGTVSGFTGGDCFGGAPTLSNPTNGMLVFSVCSFATMPQLYMTVMCTVGLAAATVLAVTPRVDGL